MLEKDILTQQYCFLFADFFIRCTVHVYACVDLNFKRFLFIYELCKGWQVLGEIAIYGRKIFLEDYFLEEVYGVS